MPPLRDNFCPLSGGFPAPPQTRPLSSSPPVPTEPLNVFYRVFRWVMLAGTVVVVMLVLRQTPPPRIESDPEAGRRVVSKIRELQKSL